jgi:phospholipid/cholesterol/gamma-HCH transport system ATP-binding protein
VTGVAVTHDIVSAYRIANRIAMLHEGRIYKVGTPQEIKDCADPVVRKFVTGVGDQEKEVSLG